MVENMLPFHTMKFHIYILKRKRERKRTYHIRTILKKKEKLSPSKFYNWDVGAVKRSAWKEKLTMGVRRLIKPFVKERYMVEKEEGIH